MTSYPAGRAEDAILVGGDVVVADSQRGVQRFTLPATGALPSVRIITPAQDTEVPSGSMLQVLGAGSGVDLDDAELLMDGSVVGSLDSRALRAKLKIPTEGFSGRQVSLQLRTRSSTGATVLSAPESQAVVTDGEVQISGSFTMGSAKSLAREINAKAR